MVTLNKVAAVVDRMGSTDDVAACALRLRSDEFG
jgi:hypothetical protein